MSSKTFGTADWVELFRAIGLDDTTMHRWHAEFESRSVRAYTELGWRNNMSIVLGVPFQSETVRLAGVNGLNATETVFGDFEFGARYGFRSGASALAVSRTCVTIGRPATG